MNKFNNTVIKLAGLIVQLAINFHEKVQTVFLPTAIKFHYTFNLRDMSNVFQVKTDLPMIVIIRKNDYYYFGIKGLMFANGECVTSTSSFIRLWLHETSRIYGDKLIEKKDQESFSKAINEQIKKTFSVSILNYYYVHILFQCYKNNQ